MVKKTPANLTTIDHRKNKKIGRRNSEPQRDTYSYPLTFGWGGGYTRRTALRPNTANLRYFSRTPYVRRAINALKNPIKLNRWEIVPTNKKAESAELKRQADVSTNCFTHPNHDDSFDSLLEKVIEDYAVFGAGCIEHQLGNDSIRPVFMWPVDAQSIFVSPIWTGDPADPRYLQMLGYNTLTMLNEVGVPLRNDELVYIKANAANDTPYGFGPVQIAFDDICRYLGIAEYAGNISGNASPENLIWLQKYTQQQLMAFRQWFRNEIEGQAQTPFIGGDAEIKAIKLHSGNDDALYLKYQEFLRTAIAVSFDLSPQNLGIERDVNRSTSEVAEDRDWDQAIKPLASTIQSYLTREVLHGRLGFYGLQFRFIGLDREDELNLATIYEKDYKNNAITPNEYRARTGKPPMDGFWGDKTSADAQIAIEAARGSKVVDDPALSDMSEDQKDSDANRQVKIKSQTKK